MGVPNLVNADELSLSLQKHGIEISVGRIVELADSGMMPHVRCDGGPPLFRKQDAKDWISTNLLTEHEGQRVPVSLSVLNPHTLDGYTGAVPAELMGMSEWLREFPLGLLRETVCVYFLIRKNRVVYVGRSEVLASRLAKHVTEKEFDRVLFFRVPKEDANNIEVAFIKLLTPPYNSTKTPGGPPPGQLNGYSRRYLEPPSTDGKALDSERLRHLVDRLGHDKSAIIDQNIEYAEQRKAMMRLLNRVYLRFGGEDGLDGSQPGDDRLRSAIRMGFKYNLWDASDLPELGPRLEVIECETESAKKSFVLLDAAREDAP